MTDGCAQPVDGSTVVTEGTMMSDQLDLGEISFSGAQAVLSACDEIIEKIKQVRDDKAWRVGLTDAKIASRVAGYQRAILIAKRIRSNHEKLLS